MAPLVVRQTEEKRDDGTDNICSARTCTYELSVPDWRVSPEELKERCDHTQTQTQTWLFGKHLAELAVRAQAAQCCAHGGDCGLPDHIMDDGIGLFQS